MKKLTSLLLVVVATVMMSSCHFDQKAIENLDKVVANFELNYEQMNDEQIAAVKADYEKAKAAIAEYKYSQADNERIGAIDARYDKTMLKYELKSAKQGLKDILHRAVGYGKELLDSCKTGSK